MLQGRRQRRYTAVAAREIRAVTEAASREEAAPMSNTFRHVTTIVAALLAVIAFAPLGHADDQADGSYIMHLEKRGIPTGFTNGTAGAKLGHALAITDLCPDQLGATSRPLEGWRVTTRPVSAMCNLWAAGPNASMQRRQSRAAPDLR